MATSPTFTLYGDTGGGPPVDHTWTRNGVVITNGGSYSISFSINCDAGRFTIERLVNSYYRSTLIVTGALLGVYRYSVNNRATPTSVDRDINIQGNNLSTCLACVYYCGITKSKAYQHLQCVDIQEWILNCIAKYYVRNTSVSLDMHAICMDMHTVTLDSHTFHDAYLKCSVELQLYLNVI